MINPFSTQTSWPDVSFPKHRQSNKTLSQSKTANFVFHFRDELTKFFVYVDQSESNTSGKPSISGPYCWLIVLFLSLPSTEKSLLKTLSSNHSKMKPLVVLFLTYLALAHSEEIQEEEDVLVLTEKNFDEAIAANKHILVEFCKYCVSLCL